MPQPLQPAEVAALFEPRLGRAMKIVADESIDVAGAGVGFSGLGSWSNQAAGLGFAGEVTADDIARIIDFHASRGAEPKVELAPHADRSCIPRLREAGFVINGFEQVLACSLAEPPPAPAADVRIEIVDPDDPAATRGLLDMQTWGFKDSDTAVPSDHDLRLFPRYMNHPSVRAVVGYVGDEPAGVALVELEPPIAQLFGGSTRPRFRRHGVQTALILARLRLAREAGCDLAATDSAPGGGTERNAVRLGFRPMYTRSSLVRPGEGLTPSP